jgi:hypothetical protein
VRRHATTRLLQAVAAAAAVVAFAAVALAVCGDANGDGEVSVSDGVQALRAAAGLSTTCNDDCDVDGSGAITVTDGVNILREAAGLASVRMCPEAGDRVESLIGHTLDLFGPLGKVGALGPAPQGSASPCDNQDGGFEQTSGGFLFDDCVFGDVSFTGFLSAPGDGSLGFSDLTVTRNGDVLTQQGTLSLDTSGENPELSGQLACSTPLLGEYVVTYGQVETDALGNTQSGGLTFDVTDSTIEGVREIRVTLTGGTSLPVIVVFTDDTEGTFSYDTETDELTPVQGTATPTPTPAATPPVARVRISNIDDRITAFLNGNQVLQAQSTGPNATNDTGFQTVEGLVCGDNVFEFRVENTSPGGGYTYRVQLEVGGSLVVERACGQAGFIGCNDNDMTQGEVVRDVTIVCVPCGPCTGGFGTCANPIQIPPSGRIQIHGRVFGANNLSGPCGGGGGPESVFVFTAGTTACYEFGTCGTTFDSQLSLGDGFCGSNGPLTENCLDDNQSCAQGGPHEITFGFFSPGQPLTIILDSEGSQGGDYVLDVRPSGQCIL